MRFKIKDVFSAEGFDLVAYTMKKTSDSISDTSSPIKESQRSNYTLLLKNKPPSKSYDQHYNVASGRSIRHLAEMDQLMCNGEPIDIANNLGDDKISSEYQILYSDTDDGTDDEIVDEQFDLHSDEHSLFFGSNQCFTTDVIDQNGVVPLDSGNGYGEKENADDVDDFRGIRNWYGSIPKPLNTNRFGMGKTRGGSALRRNILTARKSNPTHQAYNYAINNHSIKFNSSNHETTIRLDQNGSSTNTFQFLRTNGSVFRANQIIANSSATGNGVGVASILNRTGRRIGQIVQTQKLNRRLMTLGTAFDNVVTAGGQFLHPLNPKAGQIDDKLKTMKRGPHKATVVPGNFRLSNILPTGTTINGFSLDDMIGPRPRNERNISNHSGGHSSSGHEINGTAKKMKSSNFSKDSSHNSNIKTNHTSSSSSAGQSVLKNSVHTSAYTTKHSSNRSNHRSTISTGTNNSSTTTIVTMSASSSSASSSTAPAVPSTQQGNVIMVNGTSMVYNANRGRSLIKPGLYSRSVSGGSGKGSSNPRK